MKSRAAMQILLDQQEYSIDVPPGVVSWQNDELQTVDKL